MPYPLPKRSSYPAPAQKFSPSDVAQPGKKYGLNQFPVAGAFYTPQNNAAQLLGNRWAVWSEYGGKKSWFDWNKDPTNAGNPSPLAFSHPVTDMTLGQFEAAPTRSTSAFNAGTIPVAQSVNPNAPHRFPNFYNPNSNPARQSPPKNSMANLSQLYNLSSPPPFTTTKPDFSMDYYRNQLSPPDNPLFPT